MKYGLSDEQLKQIQDIISSYDEIEEAFLFGSRAIDTYKEASDVDIAIKGKKVTAFLAAKLKYCFEEDTCLPFFFGLVAYPTITNEALKKHIDTKGVSIYRAGWKECILGDVAEIIKETYLPTGSDNLSYIGLEHIEQETLRLNGIGKSINVTSNKFKFKSKDILFGKLRPYFRKVVKTKFDGICSTDIWVIRAKEGFEQNFLFYFIANRDFVNLANGAESGTKMPRADWNFLKTTEWNFPPLPGQKAIASILTSLDDKIDLLHRQNKTLETMAETLFRQWFVEEAQDDWEVKPLEKLCAITRGASPRPIIEYVLNGIVPWIKIADGSKSNTFFIDSTNEFIIEKGVSKSVKVFPGDLILSNSATCGFPYFVELEGCIHDGWLLFRDFKCISKLFTFFFLKQIFRELNNFADGSVQNNLNTGILKEYPINVPPPNLVNKFDAQAGVLIDKIKKNIYQIRTLERLRDTLLPKLMSGEVRVKYDAT